MTSAEKQFPRIFSAPSLSFFPIKILALGAPPIPIRAAKADTIIIIGKQTPSPVNAAAPSPGMCPIYILSTILYSALTTCEMIDGTASTNNKCPIGSFPKSTSFDIFVFIFL